MFSTFRRDGTDSRYSRLEQFDSIDDSSNETPSPEPVAYRPPKRRRRPQLWQVCLGLVAVVMILLLMLDMTGTVRLRKSNTPKQSAEEEVGDDQSTEFYEWHTVTSFPGISEEVAKSATLHELCDRFPNHQFQDIQPVLKTGHGALNRVNDSFHSSSACLSNLLIFSDLDEDFQDHHIIDVIGDLPNEMLTNPDIADQLQPYLSLHALQQNGTLGESHMTALEGWKTDKFKFLAGVSRAWRMAPEKRWYVFYEGDTYVLWDAVLRLLENFDADRTWYFGSPSPGRDAVWFANGGPGYILSREAMRRLVKRDWSKSGEWLGPVFQQTYWNDTLSDCCGDSVLGWTLNQHNVSLSGLWPMFNPHPLQGIPFSDPYWCEPVLTLHKTLPEYEEDLWRWEWSARSTNPTRPLLYRDVAMGFWGFPGKWEKERKDWDCGGWDTSLAPEADGNDDPHASRASCADVCKRDTACFQWTYHLKKCSFVRSFRVGQARGPNAEEDEEHTNGTWTEEDKRYFSGWNTAQIKRWMDERPCEEVHWVRPSVQRIF